MCLAFMTASLKAKVLNLTFILLNFLAWVCCCVSFGGKLIHVSHKMFGGGMIERDYYYNYVYTETHNTRIYFDDRDNCADSSFQCHKCSGGGKGLVALQVFAFLGLTAVLFMSLLRVFGKSISALEPTRKSLFLEFALTGVNAFWFFLSVCVYGGMCFHAVSNQASFKVTGTGFGYLIACFFFLLINLGVAFALRSDAATHLGSSAGGGGSDYAREDGNGPSGSSDTTNYNPPAGSYQYNASDASAAYAGSYHGDVQPATAQPVDQNL